MVKMVKMVKMLNRKWFQIAFQIHINLRAPCSEQHDFGTARFRAKLAAIAVCGPKSEQNETIFFVFSLLFS